MRATALVIALVAVLLVAAGAWYLLRGSGALSEGHHQFHVLVEPHEPGPWVVQVPALVARHDARAEARVALADLYGTAPAGGTVEGDALVLRGEGRLDWVAHRTFRGTAPVAEREAFVQWASGNADFASREGPGVNVTWSVHFLGGQGHSCSAETSISHALQPGETYNATASGEDDFAPAPPLRAPVWAILCV